MAGMFTIAPETMAVFETRSIVEYGQRLSAWVAAQPELAPYTAEATPAWCQGLARFAREHRVKREDLVARVARVRLLNGHQWLTGPEAREILGSGRDQALKVYQLECLHRGEG